MIRYSATLDDLKGRITALKPTWFDRTKAVIDNLSDEPKSSDFTGLWSDIKESPAQAKQKFVDASVFLDTISP